MNEANKEQLSAFMDGELGELQKNQVGQMLKETELLGTWRRYHLVSDCLRRSLPEHLDRELAGKVSSSIAGEPAIVAPARWSRSLAKPAAGFAIAASVAALAILGIQQQQQGVPQGIPQEPLVQSAPGAGGAGNLYAPVRQVSTGSMTGSLGTGISSECNGRPANNAPPGPARGQQAGANEAADAQPGVDCP